MTRRIQMACAAILWLVPVLILSLAFHYGWHRVWVSIRIPAAEPNFMDLRVITGGVLTFHQGGNPLIANPHDPWGRTMNYPRIWLYIFSTLGITDANLPSVGIMFCLLYLMCTSVLIFRTRRGVDAIILTIGCLSLAPLLGIERGNIDLVIFSIVFVGCLTPSKTLKSIIFAAAAALKIYPLAAVFADAVRRPATKRVTPLLLLGLVLASFAWQWRDVDAIRRGTPASSSMSYGAISLKQEFDDDWVPLLGSRAPGGWTMVLACWIGGLMVGAGAWSGLVPWDESFKNAAGAEMFSIFGAIYIFSFAVGSNWAYRLIFLLPTLPFVFELAHHPRFRRFAVIYVSLVLLAENAFGIKEVDGVTLGHLATFLLFLGIIVVLTQQWKLSLCEKDYPARPPLDEGTARGQEA